MEKRYLAMQMGSCEENSSLPVAVRVSKTRVLKLPNISNTGDSVSSGYPNTEKRESCDAKRSIKIDANFQDPGIRTSFKVVLFFCFNLINC